MHNVTSSVPLPKRGNSWAALVLLALHAILLAVSAALHSPTVDEVAYLPAGLSHWQFGRFELYRANPPLVRLVATAPLLVVGAETNWMSFQDQPTARSEFSVGRDFLIANGERALWLCTLARWACIPFSLLGGWVCYRWANEMYGGRAGLLALALWCVCPNVLGNGFLITPDLGAASLGITAMWQFWRWLKQPVAINAVSAGLALGLANLTKVNWVLLFAAWPLAWIVCRTWNAPAAGERRWTRESAGLIGSLTVAVFVMNLAYGFEGSGRRLGDFEFGSQALAGELSTNKAATRVGNRFAGSWLARIPVPLPANYVQGIDTLKSAEESRAPNYLRGEWSDQGWWYYYLYAAAVKVPLGIWGLAWLALAWTIVDARFRRPWREELLVLGPAL